MLAKFKSRKFSKIILSTTFVLIAIMGVNFAANTSYKGSPEISLASFSVTDTGKAAVMAASCLWNNVTYNGAYVGDNPNGQPASLQCGSNCPAGMQSGPNGTCVPITCANGAINSPTCNQCAAGQSLVNGRCVGQCTNGAINPGACNQCDSPRFYWNGNSCIPNPCGSVVPPSNYGQACGSGTNACGQANSSGTIQCNGSCSGNTPNNNSCIQTFILSTTSVNPNGSVEFTWRALPGIGGLRPTCGFYDRSRGNGQGLGTPIPGLQNIDITADKIRINNIQRNTEFCLVCNYAPVGGVQQTPAAAHQWVRVIRVGEN